MENMFDLLREQQEVVDIPGASPLAIRQGKIEFCNVTFSYLPERTVLKNISFSVPGGKTVAIVSLTLIISFTFKKKKKNLIFLSNKTFCVLGWTIR